MKNVTSLEELKTILETESKVLVDFWASWCGPCRMLGPIVEKIDNENEDITVIKVNADDAPDIAAEYGITSLPTVIVNNGDESDTYVGLHPQKKYVDFFNV